MKLLIALFLLFTSTSSFGQLQLVVRGLGKLLGLETEHATAYVLSKELAASYLIERSVSTSLLNNGYGIIEKNGKGYLVNQINYFTNSSYTEERQSVEQKIEKMNDTDELRIIVRNIYNGLKELLSIFDIQRTLNFLGCKLKVDGKIGNLTKTEISKVFDIDCNDKTNSEIINEIRNLGRQTSLKKQEAIYNLRITKKGELYPLKEFDKLTLEDLQKELKNDDFNYTCGLGEICSKMDFKKSNVTFECKDSKGNEISISISLEGKIDLNIKEESGISGKISVDKNGKLKVTSSRGSR